MRSFGTCVFNYYLGKGVPTGPVTWFTRELMFGLQAAPLVQPGRFNSAVGVSS